MSRSLSAPRGVSRAMVAGTIALALAVLAAIGFAPKANADFTTGKCAGPNITGRGGSFARDAHAVFNFNFKNNYCVGTPGFGTINVTYEPQGSGAGVNTMVDRTLVPRFGHTDDPPTPAQVAQMNAGTADPATDANPNDNAKVHVIPAAVGAVVAMVNFPDGCDVNDLPAASKTPEQNLDGDATPDDVIRVLFTKAQYEAIWAQGAAEGSPAAPYVTWRGVFPTLQNNAGCNEPIIRVVRFDQSGTTFAFKDYLSSINPSRLWKTKYATTQANLTREWPGATFGARADCSGTPNGPGSQDDAIDHLTTGCANGNGSLVSKLIATDGSIGYSDISTARNASPSLAITPEANDNDTYWTEVQNGSDTFTEPTADPNGFRTDGTKGANCLAAVPTGVPADTFGDWSNTSAVNAPSGYGVCTLTYGLVFDDNAAVWGTGPGRRPRPARSRTTGRAPFRTPPRASCSRQTTRRFRRTSSRSPAPGSRRSAGTRRPPAALATAAVTPAAVTPAVAVASRAPRRATRATNSRCRGRRSRPKRVARPSRSSSPAPASSTCSAPPSPAARRSRSGTSC